MKITFEIVQISVTFMIVSVLLKVYYSLIPLRSDNLYTY